MGSRAIYPGNEIGGGALYLGLTLGEILYYTASDTFELADFPGLRAILVEAVGAGGDGGGLTVNTAAGQIASGGGGASAGYARSLIRVTDLAAVEAITVGTNGAPGGDSIFDTISGEVRGKGGPAGSSSAAGAPLTGVAQPGQPAAGNVGDLTIPGQAGTPGFGLAATRVYPGAGGDTPYGHGGRSNIVSGATAGQPGTGYGSGGSGAGLGESQSTDVAGGAGADGLVTVGLLY